MDLEKPKVVKVIEKELEERKPPTEEEYEFLEMHEPPSKAKEINK